MPCERKHVEAIEVAAIRICADVTAGGSDCPVASLLDAIQAALSACDESPCVWEMVGGRVLRPSCLGENPHVMWSMWSHGNMTYCPHCGRKIAPLPAAPEVGNV